MDVQQVIDQARDHLIEYGHVNPVAFVVFAEGIVVIPAHFAGLPDIGNQCRALIHSAWDVMEEYHEKELLSLLFCSTVLVGEIVEGEAAFSFERSGKKQEALLVEEWKRKEQPGRTSYLLPVYRNTSGVVQRVLAPLKPREALSYQLTAFFHSLLLAQVVLSGPKEDREKIVVQYIYSLPYDARCELLHLLDTVGDLDGLP